jgi:hypothetical protein
MLAPALAPAKKKNKNNIMEMDSTPTGNQTNTSVSNYKMF